MSTFGPMPDWMIRDYCTGPRPMITPFEPAQVRPAGQIGWGLGSYGYDVRLSEEAKTLGGGGVLDPLCPLPDDAWDPVDLRNGSFLVRPGDLVLALTVERFDLPANVLALMLNRSKYARTGATPNAGLAPGEPGWRGRFVLELTNPTRWPVRFHVNQGLAQVVFFIGAPPERVYDGVYQDQDKVIGPYNGEVIHDD